MEAVAELKAAFGCGLAVCLMWGAILVWGVIR